MRYTTAGLARLATHAEHGRVFHASHTRGLRRFVPVERKYPGYFNGMPIRRVPLTFFTPSPEVAGILAWGRSGSTYGFGWCSHPLSRNSVAVSFVLSQANSAQELDVLRRALEYGSSQSSVYVFERTSKMTSDYPHPFELVSRSIHEPIDEVHLDALDFRVLEQFFVPLNESDSRRPVNKYRRSHRAFSGEGACAIGGHVQFVDNGSLLWPHTGLSDDIRRSALALQNERFSQFPPNSEGPWGSWFETDSTPMFEPEIHFRTSKPPQLSI